MKMLNHSRPGSTALLHCWWECKLVQPLWKTLWRFLKKLEIEIPCDVIILLLGICCKKIKTLIWKYIQTPMFIAALFTICKIWKQLKCPPIDEGIKKIWYICAMEYYSAIKNEWDLAICNNMDGPGGYYAKWNNREMTEKSKYHMISLMCRL